MKTKIAPDTIARTIVLVLALINQILAVSGKGTIEIAESDVYQVVSIVFTITAAIAAWWYNNDFTLAAMRGTELTRSLKESEKEAARAKKENKDA